MNRETTLDLARDIRARLVEGAIGIAWPSSEMLSASSDRRSNRRGQGEDHEGMKEYEPGDDIRYIDRDATLATGDPNVIIIKTFFEPRIVRFNVLLDVHASMNFGTKHTLKSRAAALAAGCGIFSAAKMKERVSFVTFSDEPHTIRKGHGASRMLTDFLIHSLEDGPDAAEQVPSGGGMAAAFRPLLAQHRGIVLVVSDFINMSEEDWEALRISGIKHDTIAVFVQDRRERELPEVPWPGASYSFEDYRGIQKTIWVMPDKIPSWLAAPTRMIGALAAKFGASAATTRQEYSENFRRREAEIVERLASCGIKTVIVSTEDELDGVRSLLRVLANKVRLL